MKPATAMLLRRSCASFERGIQFFLSGGCRFMRAGVGYHTNKSLISDHAGQPALFFCTLHSSWHLLAVREVNNCVEEGPSYRDDFRQAVLSSLLSSRVGGR